MVAWYFACFSCKGIRKMGTNGFHYRAHAWISFTHLPEKYFKKNSRKMSNFLFTDPYWCINEQIHHQ